ncbi:hypothetical protein C5167_041439 [Papaver somniferum]|nr:hypothetical protein C5167_041439 [Papaver somniferum]
MLNLHPLLPPPVHSDAALMASSSRNRRQEDSYIEYGVSYLKIYNMKSCDEDCADHHQSDPHPDFMDIDHTTEEERPPYVIVVHGPPKVGKTLLIKCLVDFYTKGSHSDMAGPIRIVAGNKRRIQFVECPNNVNGMIDAAKYADAVIFLIDAGYEFEMETFEFLELLKVHGMPKVMGVLTYLDSFKREYVLTRTRQSLLDQFQTQICKGAQLFCLSSLHNGMYLEKEISELANYISTMEFHPLSWRAARPYMLVDHFKDVTPQETVQMDNECPRNIILEGYLRGCHIEEGTKVHIAGVGDFQLASVTSLADPFPVDSGLAELTCMECGCVRAGSYVSLKFHNVPFEMVKNHNPCQPILVGGITIEEEAVGCIQAKLELHSWHLKLLKSKDPIIVSVGWRRYQTRPIYTLEDCRGIYRFLEHTPRNRLCYAMFWGPLAPPNTGLAVVQSLADNKHRAAFRFLAKASVVDVNKAARIVKKIKRFGTPCKISQKTVFIKGMFKSDLEIANFKDAKLRTASGVSGKINEPAGEGLAHGLEGIAKCTFQRKIRKHDTVRMHVCRKVKVPRFFDPIMRGPEPPDRIWEGPVDTLSVNHLAAVADRDSYRKTYIDPSEPRHREIRSMFKSVVLAKRRAITKKDKLAVERQNEELKSAARARLSELKSKGVLPRRRQTLEQSEWNQSEAEKQSAFIWNGVIPRRHKPRSVLGVQRQWKREEIEQPPLIGNTC